MSEGEEIKEVKIARPTKRLCGRCAFARMSDNKILNAKREIDECHFTTPPRRILSLSRCPKKLTDVFNTAEDRKKGNFEG
jgi:hypothetical protein